MGVRYRPEIDGLRAIAVVTIILFHAWPRLIPAAPISVDVFFVISGYLITSSIADVLPENKFSLRDFYFRRVRRIFPTLLILLTSVLLVGWFLLLPDEFHVLAKHTLAGLGFCVNFVLLRESGYFDLSSQGKPLLHLWTLSIEEQFYLLWPLVLLGGFTFFRKLLPVIVTVITVSLISFAGMDDFYFFTHARIWAIAAGGLIAILPEKKIPSPVSLFALVLLVLSFFFFESKWGHVFGTLCALIIIMGGSTLRILRARPLVYTGLISYPLYLWHWPLLAGAQIISNHSASSFLRAILIACSFLLAVLTYEFVEKPLKAVSPKKAAAWFISFSLVLAGLSAGLYFSDVQTYQWDKSGEEALMKFDARAKHPKYLLPLLKDRYVGAHFCHMFMPNQTLEAYLKVHGDCLKLSTEKPNVLILGDSLAEELHAALKLTHPEYHFIHFAGTACDPIRKLYKDKNSECYKVTNYGFELARSPGISEIIIATRWNGKFAEILPDILELKGLGKKVSIAGPSVVFRDEVPKFLSRRNRGESLSELMQRSVYPEAFLLNEHMRKWALENQVPFIDKISILCPGKRCMMVTPEGAPYYRDNVHLLKDGLKVLGTGIRP